MATAESKWDAHHNGLTFRHADGVRWQLQATRLLEALLRRSLKDDLPRLTWLIPNAGARLVGQCRRGDVTAQRAAFNAWVDAIGATPWPERTDSLGTTHLRAVVERYQEPSVDGAWATVAILAELFDQRPMSGERQRDRSTRARRRPASGHATRHRDTVVG